MKAPCVIEHYLMDGERIFVNTIDDASGFIGFMTRKNLVEVFNDA